MREEWQISRLQDLCEQMNGIWKGVKEPFVTAKILRTTNFSKECQLKLDDLAIIEVEKKKMDARRLRKGDIVVEKSGGGPKQPVGRAILFNIDDTDFSFCNFTSTLRVKDSTKILPEYLHKYLTYLYFSGATEKYQSNLVGFRNLDFKGYVSMEIKYPSLEEQQHIVDILDKEFAKIDNLKANAERSIKESKDFFNSALKKELAPKEGWVVKTIAEIADIKGGKRVPKGYKLLTERTAHPYIRVADFDDNGSINLDDIHFISEDVYQGIKRYIIESSDVYISIAGTIGKSGIIPDVLNGANLTENACRLILKKGLYNRFIYYCTINAPFKEQVSRLTMQAAQPKLALTRLATIKVAIPPLKEQYRVVSILDRLCDNCQSLQDNYMKTLTLCDDLKQSLLRKAFNGEL